LGITQFIMIKFTNTTGQRNEGRSARIRGWLLWSSVSRSSECCDREPEVNNDVGDHLVRLVAIKRDVVVSLLCGDCINSIEGARCTIHIYDGMLNIDILMARHLAA